MSEEKQVPSIQNGVHLPEQREWVGGNGCEISVSLELILADEGRERRTELGLF